MSVSTKGHKNLMEKIEEHLKLIEEATGVNSRFILIGLGICFLFVFVGYFDLYITNFVGIVYPAIWSIRAIESKGTEDDKQWLTYWVVFACFTFLDLFSGFVIKFIPFYFFFKLIFLIWCFMPNTRGATFIYDNIIIKLFHKYEYKIKGFDETIQEKIGTAVKDGQECVSQNKEKVIATNIKEIQEVMARQAKKLLNNENLHLIS
jgi:receptor expression-enhancing protein 5/6